MGDSCLSSKDKQQKDKVGVPAECSNPRCGNVNKNICFVVDALTGFQLLKRHTTAYYQTGSQVQRDKR